MERVEPGYDWLTGCGAPRGGGGGGVRVREKGGGMTEQRHRGFRFSNANASALPTGRWWRCTMSCNQCRLTNLQYLFSSYILKHSESIRVFSH